MLRAKMAYIRGKQRGDTLIEVTFALAILGFVLLGSTAIAAAAFRMGQTARERTQVAEAAQGQLEALRSFRDNHTWPEFRGGKNCGAAGGFCGIDQVIGSPCSFDATQQCFHMVEVSTAGGTSVCSAASCEWVPAVGSMSANVPTSVIEITPNTPNSQRGCGYDFLLHYSFTPLGGGTATNQITTRLVNLKYDPGIAPPVCPS
jgi:Tfp pilus assembly protein PilV